MIHVRMPTELYLDTARLGRMCEGARKAEHDFARLVSRLGSPLYWDRFLSQGFQSLPENLQRQFRGLNCWRGFNQLLDDLGEFINQPTDCSTFVFSQSRNMIRFAAEFLTRNCQRILTTDLEWPPYVKMLKAIGARNSCEVVLVPLCRAVFERNFNGNEVTHRLLTALDINRCDGTFLSDITYLGVRMPLDRIAPSLKERQIVTVIDGAQALNHRPINLSRLECDLYLAGTQKWFQAYYPLRFAIAADSESNSDVQSLFADLTESETISDPLTGFCEELAGNHSQSFGETVNVLPLITAAGALAELRERNVNTEESWKIRRRNARAFASFFSRCVKIPDVSLQSGITLVAKTSRNGSANVTRARQQLQSKRIVASSFANGLIRFSMPDFYLPCRYLSEVQRELDSNSFEHFA